MSTPDKIACVILAGGQGKRMASADQHKVCFSILGRPAIVRAIDTYKRAGLRRFLVVVGQMAEQVIATVSAKHPEVSFVYQGHPRGTGHAALVAAEALAAQHYDGPVLLTMGDKVTRPAIVAEMVQRFADSSADVMLTALPTGSGAGLGHVIVNPAGKLLGIVEQADIEEARRTGKRIVLNNRKYTAGQIEKMTGGLNASLYVYRFDALYPALKRLGSGNVQAELYVTDTIADLAGRGGAEVVTLDDPSDLMAFNTPAELIAIEEVLREREKPPRVRLAGKKRLSPAVLKPAGKWLTALETAPAASSRALRKLYGPDERVIDERRREMARLVRAFAKRFGPDRPMIICRAPGRINLMGRHVDHRGGYVNVMAISREVLLAAAPRTDGLVTLHNLRSKAFPPRQFDIREMLSEASWTEWLDFVASRAVRNVLESAPGDWSHYARAPLLRLQHECPQAAMAGMDCVVTGNIPMGAGLSSSSAMVVSFAAAAVAINGLDVTMHDFVDLCGEGEWFVGSRGGSADHAAISSSRRGYISQIGFYPYRLVEEVRFQTRFQVAIAYSGTQAIKSAAARDVFNHRVACYDIAEMLLRRLWPAASGAEHLRDLTPDKLQVADGEVFRALMRLPTRPTREQIRRLLPPEDRDRLERIFSTHANQGTYDLRGVALYGLSECLRSERFADCLKNADLATIGRDMRNSHDGDRRVRFSADSSSRAFVTRTDDATLKRLIATGASLYDQCGRYRCSTEAIDHMVDIAHRVDGVVGAQLAGAGLGGCMMVLVRRDAMGNLLRRLRKDFYKPRGIDFAVQVCEPVAGASLVRL